MDESRTASVQADRISVAYTKQQEKAKAFNARLDAGQLRPPLLKRIRWCFSKKGYKKSLADWPARVRKRPSLAWALLYAGGANYSLGILFKIIGDMSQLCAPLITRNLIEFAQEKAAARASGAPEPNIGRGVGDAIGLLLLTIMASVWQHAYFYRSMSTGAMLRAGLTRIIFDKGLSLSQEARIKHNNGKLMADLSNSVERINYATQWLGAVFTAPLQISVATVLLCLQLGWSALIGIFLFILLIPLQSKIMSYSIKFRKQSMVWTDRRTRTLQELLSNFAILKYFCFENAYLKRIGEIRGKELVGIWRISLVKAANQGMSWSRDRALMLSNS